MKESIKNRLSELKSEYETGIRQMEQLKKRIKDLRQTLLRISGAIQVLEELDVQKDQKKDQHDKS